MYSTDVLRKYDLTPSLRALVSLLPQSDSWCNAMQPERKKLLMKYLIWYEVLIMFQTVTSHCQKMTMDDISEDFGTINLSSGSELVTSQGGHLLNDRILAPSF